ncbi:MULTISPECIES: hypothetical protein [unclassified Bradyrhizobium]|uniref:hypothetical protein n=1 Tax=unclassified Bradyrhizobium TaxID=2631580 RepID=UPI001CD7BA94|nr:MULTISPECIES: hypothetical protein [unclassified Bradyrhizobium]MCA1378774.1 hypothetical protein [Bradyrhizobium sp. IC4060]MCA1487776.1 hypothetical protein [Bradyrhizobium sp. IC4061]
MAKKPSSSAGSDSVLELAKRQSDGHPRNEEIDLLKQTINELHERDAKREQELCHLNQALSRLSQMSAIECILTNGFEELSTKLAPLAEIGPHRVPITDGAVNARLASMIEATARPSWSGASTVPIPTRPVPFIGEVVPRPRDYERY